MRKYKLILLLKSSLTKDKKEKLLADLKKWVGDVEKEEIEDLGEKKLSYLIRKEKTADYVIVNFESNKGFSAEVEKKLFIDDNVLRHLIVKD